MLVYVLKDGTTKNVIGVFDNETNANQMMNNILLTGEYRSVTMEPKTLNTDTVSALSVVAISGTLYNNEVTKLTVSAMNPTTTITDNLSFNVDSGKITFSGEVNLTTDEKALTTSDALLAVLVPRCKEYVTSQFSVRLMNDNPTI